MGADDDDDTVVARQMAFLEVYEKGTQGAPPAPTSTPAAPPRPRQRRASGRQSAARPGVHWVLASSCLAVACNALRALDAIRGDEWRPPAWLTSFALSEAQTVRVFADRIVKRAEVWYRESEDDKAQ